jgi:hypothetical protein
LEAAWGRTNDLDSLRLARPTLGGKHRDDSDAVQFEIGLDAQYLADATVFGDHRSGDYPAGL